MQGRPLLTATVAVLLVAFAVAWGTRRGGEEPPPADAPDPRGAEAPRATVLPPPDHCLELAPSWTERPPSAEQARYGIVRGAVRRLRTLQDGTPAHGEGGLLHLAITDAPRGATIEQLLASIQMLGR